MLIIKTQQQCYPLLDVSDPLVVHVLPLTFQYLSNLFLASLLLVCMVHQCIVLHLYFAQSIQNVALSLFIERSVGPGRLKFHI